MAAKQSEPPARPRRRIQSIDVGFRLIRVLEAAAGPLPLGAVAQMAGMPASKAHLYMVSFTELGLVVQDPTTMRYGLGPYALQLGAAALRQIDVVELAREPMSALQEATGALVFLSVWGNRGPVIVAKVDGTVDLLVSIRVGHVLPLDRSATGRTFLAYKPRAAIEHVLANMARVDHEMMERANAALPLIRKRRLAFSESQINTGFASICSPIFDYAGEIAAAVTILGMRHDIDLDPLGPVAERVGATAAGIGRQLGFEAEDALETAPVEPQKV